MVVISQIWVQHLQCTQIIGHCHLRAGSAVEPDLAANLHSVMIIVLADVEQEFQYTMSGVYSYKIPDLEGIAKQESEKPPKLKFKKNIIIIESFFYVRGYIRKGFHI